MQSEDFSALVGFLFAATVLALAATAGCGRYQTEQGCLRQGYSGMRYSLFGDEYCVIRRDQSDVVVPWAEAMRIPASEAK